MAIQAVYGGLEEIWTLNLFLARELRSRIALRAHKNYTLMIILRTAKGFATHNAAGSYFRFIYIAHTND